MQKCHKDSVYIDLIQYTDYIWLSDDPQISMMWSFFAPPKSTPPAVDSDTNNNPDELTNISGLDMDWTWGEFAEAVTYWSDEEDLDDEPLLPMANLNEIDSSPSSSAAPPRKRQKLNVPYQVQVAQKSDAYKQQQAAWVVTWQEALMDIQNLFRSKRTKFISGDRGLQAKQAKAIETHLCLVLKNGRCTIDASQWAAEAGGFAEKSGGHAVQRWTWVYVELRKLPVLHQGHHAKVYLLLSDPEITAELQAYIHSNK